MAITGDAVLEEAVSQIGLWVKGLGLIALVAVVYSVTMFLINRKQAKDLDRIKQDLDEINIKIDKLIKKK